MRVIAGSARSLLLKTPDGMDTRPTQDRVKETLFNMLQFDVPDCAFLDLFAGSGAIGIEALSRGADSCVFVENGKEAHECIVSNLAHTKLDAYATVYKQDVFVAMTRMEYQQSFDIVFMDPPYRMELEQRVLEYLATSTIIDQESIVIFEASLDTDLAFLDHLPYEVTKVKRYKTNMHVFLKRSM